MHSNISGYLNEYEMFRRMGKNSCIIDGQLEIWNCRREVEEDLKFRIEDYNDYDTDTLNGLMGALFYRFVNRKSRIFED